MTITYPIISFAMTRLLVAGAYRRGDAALPQTLSILNILWFAFLAIEAAFLLWTLVLAAARHVSSCEPAMRLDPQSADP